MVNINSENVGRVLDDSFKILGLGLGASEREVKQAYRELA
jgi:curved DNA-binding protein CbpA